MIDPSLIKVAWIDLDDTLIDFRANSRSALAKVYATTPRLRELFATPEEWIAAYQFHNHRLWADLSAARITRSFLITERFRRPLTEAGMPEAEALAMAATLHTRYLDLLALEHRTLPGAHSLLRRLREAGITVGVLSNGFKEVQYRKMDSAGLTPLVDLTVLSDDIGVQKPDIRLFRHAMERSGVADPAAHIMVGDNPQTDIAGALAAGWSAILFDPAATIAPPPGALTVSALSDITLRPPLTT